MLDEPAGLRPRLREDCSVLAGRVPTAGVFSSRLVRSPLGTRQRPRAPRKSRKPVPLTGRAAADFWWPKIGRFAAVGDGGWWRDAVVYQVYPRSFWWQRRGVSAIRRPAVKSGDRSPQPLESATICGPPGFGNYGRNRASLPAMRGAQAG